MNPPALIFLSLGLTAAAVDWVAVAKGSRRLEYLAKPATLIALILAAIALEPRDVDQRTWFTIALALSLAGDIFLMLPRDLFVPGLSAFLLAHLAYVGGFAQESAPDWGVAISLFALALAAAPLAWRIVRGASARDPRLGVAVGLYVAVITAMGAFAVGSGSPVAATGGLLFITSDTLIGLDRFVKAWRNARLAIMVTYHLAQVLLVLSLV